MTQLNTEYNRENETLQQTAPSLPSDWFRWESQGHTDFVAIQINMLKRLADKRQLFYEDLPSA